MKRVVGQWAGALERVGMPVPAIGAFYSYFRWQELSKKSGSSEVKSSEWGKERQNLSANACLFADFQASPFFPCRTAELLYYCPTYLFE